MMIMLSMSSFGRNTKQIMVSAKKVAALLVAVAIIVLLSTVASVAAQDDTTDTTTTTPDVGIGGVSDITVVSIGDTYCVEGYVMDSYCIDLGSLLDAPNIRTLEGPDKHSIHCLVDVGPCLNSQFEILTPPTSQDSNKYERSWRLLDDDSQSILVDLARSIGSCSTCNGGYNSGGQRSGFKAVMDATIVNFRDGEIPPIISITQAYDSTQFESSTQACQQYFPDLELGTIITGEPGTGTTTNGDSGSGNGNSNSTTDMPPSTTSAPILQGRYVTGGHGTIVLTMLMMLLPGCIMVL